MSVEVSGLLGVEELEGLIGHWRKRANEAEVKVRELSSRIEAGERKLAEAEAAGRPVLEIKGKLSGLGTERARLQREEQTPLFLLQRVREMQETCKGQVPPGAKLRLLLPDVLDIKVSLDEVPF